MAIASGNGFLKVFVRMWTTKSIGVMSSLWISTRYRGARRGVVSAPGWTAGSRTSGALGGVVPADSNMLTAYSKTMRNALKNFSCHDQVKRAEMWSKMGRMVENDQVYQPLNTDE